MPFTTLFNTICNTGIRPRYQPWEIYLTRKLNMSSLLGMFNIIIALIVFVSLGYRGSIMECMVSLALSPLVFLFNRWFGYFAALQIFAFIGCFLFFFISVRMGLYSFSFLYYFPLILGLIQMAGRKEALRHLAFALLQCMLSIIGVLICFKYDFMQVQLSAEFLSVTRYLNIFFCFFVSVGFMLIITAEAIRQENQLKSAVEQKDILLAEVFHRVKNNLNIVTSLLNLKKNSISSAEGQNALEECRNMVFSMALVHTRIYNSENVSHVKFNEYLQELSGELVNSVGGRDQVDFRMESSPITLGLSQAILCGLIMNELITNSFKHAQLPGKKLCISVKLWEGNGLVMIESHDNGPGPSSNDQQKNSLGLELIRSLAGQLDGEHHFENKDGFYFRLAFKKTPQSKPVN